MLSRRRALVRSRAAAWSCRTACAGQHSSRGSPSIVGGHIISKRLGTRARKHRVGCARGQEVKDGNILVDTAVIGHAHVVIRDEVWQRFRFMVQGRGGAAIGVRAMLREDRAVEMQVLSRLSWSHRGL